MKERANWKKKSCYDKPTNNTTYSWNISPPHTPHDWSQARAMNYAWGQKDSTSFLYEISPQIYFGILLFAEQFMWKKKCYIFIRCGGYDRGIQILSYRATNFNHPRLFLINSSVTSFVKISDERVHPCDGFTSWVPFAFPPLWISTDTCKVYVLSTLSWFSPSSCKLTFKIFSRKKKN